MGIPKLLVCCSCLVARVRSNGFRHVTRALLSPTDIKSRGVDDDAFTPLAFLATGDVCSSGTLFTSSAKHFVSI